MAKDVPNSINEEDPEFIKQCEGYTDPTTGEYIKYAIDPETGEHIRNNTPGSVDSNDGKTSYSNSNVDRYLQSGKNSQSGQSK